MKIAHIHVWDKKNKGDVAIVLAVQELLRKKFPSAKIVDFSVEILKKITKRDVVNINKCDLVVIGGGGIYYHWFMPYNINSIKKIKPPIVIFGVGYIREIGARKLTRTEIASIVFLNNFAKLVSVRDYYTKKFLIKYGVQAKKIKVIGDPAIFLTEEKIKNLKFKNKVKIGFNLNYSGWMGFGKYEKNILDSYKKTLAYFKTKYNADIYYLLHHPDEKKILKKLNIKNIKIIDLPPNQQKYFYSKMDLIIGMMLHSVVLAFGALTPEINVGYDLRNKSFAQFINCPELIISSDKLNKQPGHNLLSKSKTVLLKKKDYIKKFIKRKSDIWQQQEKFLNQIDLLIKSDD